jgi:hypothetical protein
MTTELRLLACQQCRTIEELPDFNGPAEQDHLLSFAVKKHQTNGMEHIGALFKVPEKDWADSEAKKTISQQIAAKMEGGETGLGHEFYDLKNQFQEDAANCFQEHNRSPTCGDYRSDRKRLTPGTSAERKAAGLPEYRSPKDQYLCDFCPVQSLVEQAQRAKALT